MKELIKELRKIESGELTPTTGLCAVIEFNGFMGDTTIEKCRDYMEEWPKYSGSSMYPVPHVEFEPYHAFVVCDKYDSSTQYGRDRRELAGYIADRLEAKWYHKLMFWR